MSLLWLAASVSPSGAQSAFFAKAKEEGRVLVYTSLAASDNKPFQAAFEQAHPGVKLELYRASGTTILQKILTEHRAGAHLADAVLTEGAVLYALKDAGLLEKFDSPERKAFEPRFKDKEGYWTEQVCALSGEGREAGGKTTGKYSPLAEAESFLKPPPLAVEVHSDNYRTQKNK